uniref:Uncharacterized protein n=1 Tax=uncultured organism TaxID=155900 RepID=M1P170_9ZZZZ|nr:hypothetical protein FLSS-17_0024 [uncultured organism]
MLSLLSGFGSEVYSQKDFVFSNIPEKWKFELMVNNPKTGVCGLQIKGFFWEKKIVKKAVDMNWKEYSESEPFQKVQNLVEDPYHNNGALYIVIKQIGDKSFPFNFHNLALTQDTRQYVNHKHFYTEGLNSTWQAIEAHIRLLLRPGVNARGVIFLPEPEQIDLNRAFTIWYKDSHAKLNAKGLDTE